MIKQSIGLQNDKFDLSSSPEINWHIVRDNPNISWNWDKLTVNPCMKLEDILQNHEYPWNWNQLSYHKELTKNNILPDKPWNWPYLSKRFHIPWTDIHDGGHIDYTDNCLLMNLRMHAVLTSEFINLHPEINWFTNELLRNESLSVDYLLSLCNKIRNFDLLAVIFRNDFRWDLVFRYPDIHWGVESIEELCLDNLHSKVKTKKVLKQEANGIYLKH